MNLIPAYGIPLCTLTFLRLRQAPGMPLINTIPVAPSSRTVPASVSSANSASIVSVDQTISAVGIPANPAVPVSSVPGVPQAKSSAPAIPPAANPIAPAVAPIITTTTSLPSSPSVEGDFVSVQWVETKIGGTQRTWVPKTITFNFRAYTTQGSVPGRGEIGMGTLTGDTGKTKTVVMGAALTHAPGWLKGVAAAVGVGVAGMV